MGFLNLGLEWFKDYSKILLGLLAKQGKIDYFPLSLFKIIGVRMEIVKKTDKYLFVKKRNGRFGVKTLKGQWINGEQKQNLLAAEGLIKLTEKSAKPEENADESTEAASAEASTTDQPAAE